MTRRNKLHRTGLYHELESVLVIQKMAATCDDNTSPANYKYCNPCFLSFVIIHVLPYSVTLLPRYIETYSLSYETKASQRILRSIPSTIPPHDQRTST